MRPRSLALLACVAAVAAAQGCSRSNASSTTSTAEPTEPDCLLVEDGYGSPGPVPVRAETFVSGLEIPWSVAFLPGGGALVTERPGRVRLVRDGALVPEPVTEIVTGAHGEGGLLGLVLHPRFAENREFFVYYTADKDGRAVNRVARYVLAPDGRSAQQQAIVLDGIPAATFHDGGRMRLGPDGLLYIGTGDAGEPRLSQDPDSLAGKVLRLTPEGTVPPDNPRQGNPLFLLGVRNVQAFDWLPDGRIVVADHGPSGELGRRGHDEITVAAKGDNLGWPGTWRCETSPGIETPEIVWERAVPPGGALYYRGDAIPEWTNSFLVGTLESRHLHRVVLTEDGRSVKTHELYFRDQFGRLRDVIAGPDGAIYVTTSNCDGRGTCPPEKDKVLRITSAR